MAKNNVPYTTPTLTLEQRLANLESIVNQGLIKDIGVDSLTAHAGGGQANGTPITKTLNRFTTVATIADSATLPQSVGADGIELVVINASTNSMNVFPAVGEIINALSANAAFALAGGKSATFYSVTGGQWHTILSA